MRNQQSVFEEIYQKNRWGKGSGTGSSPDYCKSYIDFLRGFIVTKGVQSVLDVGCGDWQLYRDMSWEHVKYTGCDISQTALNLAKRNGATNVHLVTTIDDTLHFIKDNPSNLILIKDVMMHWTDDEIKHFLTELLKIEGWSCIITSNNWKYSRSPEKNGQPRELDKYSWAPIPVEQLEPYGFTPLFRYPTGGHKQVMINWRHS